MALESLERAAKDAEEAGDVERLEALHAQIAEIERDTRARENEEASIAMSLAIGERRAAFRALEAIAAAGDADARARAVELAAKRARGAFVRIALGERLVSVDLALGRELVIGRTAGLRVASNAIGRKHVAIARRADGAIVLRDLGSRNGTTLRGARVTGEIPIGEGVDVMLGGEVPMRVRPSDAIAGAAAIDVGGATWVAPLDAGLIGIGAWTIVKSEGTTSDAATSGDGWLELVTTDDPPAFAREIQLAPRVQLLAGDAFSRVRNGPIVLRVRSA